MKDVEEAREHLARAEARIVRVSPRERDYVRLLGVQLNAVLAPEAEREVKHQAYKRALDAFIASVPEEAEAWIRRGQAQEPEPWGRGLAGEADALPFYQGALERVPDHFGAHHYLAHTCENLGRYPEAVRHAEAYVRQAPKVPHAQHMLGHVLPRVGRWADAIARFERADTLERAYYSEQHIPRGADWHRVHNLSLLGVAYLQAGRASDAERTLREAFDTAIPDPVLQFWHAVWPEYLLVRARHREAEDASRALGARDSPVARVVGRALAGEALLGAGRRAEALEAEREARSELGRLRQAFAGHPFEEYAATASEQFLAVLAARLALRSEPASGGERQVEVLAEEIARTPTFDGWGAGWLRLRRLAEDARATGHAPLADRLGRYLR